MAIKVTLLTHTPNPEQTVAMAAKLCYSPSGIEDIRDEILCSVKKYDIMITVYSFCTQCVQSCATHTNG